MRAFDDILRDLGFREAATKLRSPRLQTLSFEAAESTLKLYSELGGTLQVPKLRPGGWDLQYSGNFVVELDEQLHFNRYRALTLESPLIKNLPWTESYRKFTTDYEGRCLSDSLSMAGKWTSAGSVNLFGSAGTSGDFTSNGSPRWKQRALYDYMKDAAAADGETKLIRLSIYDRVGSFSLDEILEPRLAGVVDVDALRSLISRRLSGPVCELDADTLRIEVQSDS